MPVAQLFDRSEPTAEPSTGGRRWRSRTWAALGLMLLGFTVVGVGVTETVRSWFGPDCRDRRQDCDQSESKDMPLPDALQRFSLTLPCQMPDLRYAYDTAWNDGTQWLGLHATLSPDCLNALTAELVPGVDLSKTQTLKPGDLGFPLSDFPNGPYGAVTPGHTYRLVKAERPGQRRQAVTLLVDTSTPKPVIVSVVIEA